MTPVAASPDRVFRLVILTLLASLAPMIWGSTYIVTTEILPEGRPLMAAALRTLPAGLLLLIGFGAWRLPVSLWRILVLSLINISGFQALLFLAAYRLPGGQAALLGAISPVLILALNWMAGAGRPRWSQIALALCGLAGMGLLVFTPGLGWDPVGVIAALAGTSLFAIGILLTRSWGRNAPLFALTGWQLTLGGAALLPAALAFEPALPVLSHQEIGGYLYLCLAGGLAGYVFWFTGLTRLPPVAMAALGLLSPVTATLLGWALLGQSLPPLGLVGMLIILVSVFALQVLASPQKGQSS